MNCCTVILGAALIEAVGLGAAGPIVADLYRAIGFLSVDNAP